MFNTAVTSHLNGRISEPEEMAVPRQWHGKHVSTATGTSETIEELWEVLFSVWSMPRLYNED
jgi:hypothetical protein